MKKKVKIRNFLWRKNTWFGFYLEIIIPLLFCFLFGLIFFNRDIGMPLGGILGAIVTFVIFAVSDGEPKKLLFGKPARIRNQEKKLFRDDSFFGQAAW